MKGKIVCSKSKVVEADRIQKPKEIKNLQETVFFTADIFFVNRIPFFITFSRNIYFTGISNLHGRTALIVFNVFKEFFRFYLQWGFLIQTVHDDGEFGALQVIIQNIPAGPRVNLTSADEQVPEIEQRMWVVKKRSRSFCHIIHFNRIPRLMVIYIVLNISKMLNYFPTKGGIFVKISPHWVIIGDSLDYKNHLRIQVWKYCQVHENETPSNNNKARTQGAICLVPCSNLQGGYRFMSLKTGSKIMRYHWNEIPML